MAYALGGDARQRRRGDRDLQGDPRRRRAERSEGAAALDRLYLGAEAVARRSPTTCTRQLHAHRRQARRRSRCSCASRRCARRELGEVAAAVETYRQVLDLDATNDDARRARSSGWCTLPEHELQIATILEPIYKARDEWQKQIGVVRDHGAPLVRSGAQDRAAPPDRRAVRDGGEDAEAFRTYVARCARSRRSRRRRRARAAGAHARSLEGPGRALRLGRRAGGAARATSSCRRSS